MGWRSGQVSSLWSGTAMEARCGVPQDGGRPPSQECLSPVFHWAASRRPHGTFGGQGAQKWDD